VFAHVPGKIKFFGNGPHVSAELQVAQHSVRDMMVLLGVGSALQLLHEVLQIQSCLFQLECTNWLPLLNVACVIPRHVALSALSYSGELSDTAHIHALALTLGVMSALRRRHAKVRRCMGIVPQEDSHAWRCS
jgi:hypothetical protein